MSQLMQLNKYDLLKNKVPYPSILIILLRISNSEDPGNRGSPRNNSATMHPNDHMSIAVVYLCEVKVPEHDLHHEVSE